MSKIILKSVISNMLLPNSNESFTQVIQMGVILIMDSPANFTREAVLPYLKRQTI